MRLKDRSSEEVTRGHVFSPTPQILGSWCRTGSYMSGSQVVSPHSSQALYVPGLLFRLFHKLFHCSRSGGRWSVNTGTVPLKLKKLYTLMGVQREETYDTICICLHFEMEVGRILYKKKTGKGMRGFDGKRKHINLTPHFSSSLITL